MATTTTAGSTLSRSSSWTNVDPYKEFELYLEKAHEEIGQVFHQLEAASSLRANTNSAIQSCQALPTRRPNSATVVPPPVPVRRLLNRSHNLNRKPGLKVTADYTYLDGRKSAVQRRNNANNWPLISPTRAPKGDEARPRDLIQQWNIDGLVAASHPRPVRRTSCPSFHAPPPPDDPPVIESVDIHHGAALSGRGNVNLDARWQRKGHQGHPRRGNPRYLTADLHFEPGKLKAPVQRYDSNSIHLWTSSLMAEFNHIIDSELQRLASGRDGDCTHFQSPSGDSTFHSPAVGHVNDRGRSSSDIQQHQQQKQQQQKQRPQARHCKEEPQLRLRRRSQSLDNSQLSPWAKMQLSLIEQTTQHSVASCTVPKSAGQLDSNDYDNLWMTSASSSVSDSSGRLNADASTDDADAPAAAGSDGSNGRYSADKRPVQGPANGNEQLTNGARADDVLINKTRADQAAQSTSSRLAPLNVGGTNRPADSSRCSAVSTAAAAGGHCPVQRVTQRQPAVEKLAAADVEVVERQIINDLDRLEAPPSHPPPCRPLDYQSPACDASVALNSPLLRPQELQDFLRRVEDSIRTTSGPDLDNAAAMAVRRSRTECKLPTALSMTQPREEEGGRGSTPTFDATTQTSPMSLSRSSSFLWVSDCNCSVDSSNGPAADIGGRASNASMASNATSLLVAAPLSISRRSLPATASEAEAVTTEVNMDTSLSSLISESSDCIDSSAIGTHHQRPAQITPDSAAEADADVDAEESSISLSRSFDPLDAGIESGIGTGSPPPRDRRSRRSANAVGSVQVTASKESSESASGGSASGSESSVGGDFEGDGSSSTKKRDKVRRRETWEKIRRRHSCKRAHSRRNKDKEIVWVKRESVDKQSHAGPVHGPVESSAAEPLNVSKAEDVGPDDRVLHKPPVVVIQSVPRPKPRTLLLRNAVDVTPPSLGDVRVEPILYNTMETPRTERGFVDLGLTSPSAGSVKLALHSVLAMELSNSNKSSSTPLLKVESSDRCKHAKPASATSTPTDPHISLETSLTTARSHSETAFAELEATEACRWLRATGFPQYAQMYEDWQFPLDLNVVQRDHQFLDDDSLHALFRRLTILNRTAKLRGDSRTRPQGDESDEEDQECALSDQWTFQRHSRRWSRIVDLPDDCELSSIAEPPPPLLPTFTTDAADDDNDDTLVDDTDRTADPVILGSFRRSSSERLRHGAKSLLRRMESLRSRNRRRPPRTMFDGANRNGVVISGPQLVDASAMEDRMKELNCVDLTPPDSATPSSTPSPDLNRIKTLSQFDVPELNSPSATPSPCSSVSTQASGQSLTKSKSKAGRKFFQRRSRTTAEDQKEDQTLSDSECSPNYWRRSFSTSKDANSNDTASPWSLDNPAARGSTRWKVKSKLTRELSSGDENRSQPVDSPRSTDSKESQSLRDRLYLNFKTSASSRNKVALLPSPEDEEAYSGHTTGPIIIRNTSYQEVSTPSAAERKLESETLGQDSTSTGTGTSGGSHADSDYSPAQSCRAPVVVRWHSFRRGSSQSIFSVNQSISISSLTVGQFSLLRKLALLRLTALLERHTSATKPTWGWDLPKFMRKTKAPDYKDKTIFGVPLSVTVQRSGEALPRPILLALHMLRQSALDQIGLFRKSGVRSRIGKLKEMCQLNGPDETIDFSDQQPYDVADMVKQYFRELPEALLTNKLSETFVTIFQVVPANQRLDALRCAVLLLPDEHREALQTFLYFLTDVAALSSVNQMTASNLAVCLAPSLFHLPATAAARSTSASPRRRKTVGVPDQRELSENKAAHECLLQMISDCQKLFFVPEDMLAQCRCTYLEDSVPVSLEDLHTVEFGDWQAYMNGSMAALVKETKDKSRGWVSISNELRVDIAWKKVGDGHLLRLWKVSAEIEAPPAELLNRVLHERHLWDTAHVKGRLILRLDKKSEVFQYTSSTSVPPASRDFCVLRSWRNDLPRGTCLVAETSIEHSDATSTPGTTRGIVLASRYLIEPCGAGKSRLVHLSRVDTKGRSPEWYNKHYGHICALHIARIRDSFSHVADGPESKV